MSRNIGTWVVAATVLTAAFAWAAEEPAEAPAAQAQATQPAADKQGPNAGAKATSDSPEAQAVQRLQMAYQLAAYGQQQKDPLALTTAARILKQTPVKEQARQKKTEGTAPAQEAAKKDKPAVTAESLLEQAKQMAAGNETVLALVQQVETERSRGAVSGPNEHPDRVKARTTDSYRIAFRGGEAARVAVIGDGDTDLDLYVYDENGNAIASDTDGTDRCVVEWVPRWTGTFTVRIANLGNVYNEYVLLTN